MPNQDINIFITTGFTSILFLLSSIRFSDCSPLLHSFDVTKIENENLDQSEVIRLLKDMKLMPTWLNQQQALDGFKASSFDDAGTVSGHDMTRLISHQEFRMLLVHLALTIFGPNGKGSSTSYATTDEQMVCSGHSCKETAL
jgi:hypothetical protein